MKLPHRTAYVSLAFSFLMVTASVAQSAENTTDNRFQLSDVFELEYASDPQISPDGSRVVYVRNFMDAMKDRRRSNIWSINTDGNDHRPITTGNGNDSSPRWSPDGTKLIYVSTKEGSTEIYCRWMDTGQTAKLTQLQTAPENILWSHNGRSIAFTMLVLADVEPFAELPSKPEGAEWAKLPKVIQNTLYRADGKGYLKNGFQHLFVLPAEGGTPRQLSSGNFHHHGPLSWSADDKSLFCTSNRNVDWEYEPRESEIYEVSVSDRKIRPLTNRKGPDHHPVVSHDGRQIAWLGFNDDHLSYQTTRLNIMNRDGSEQRIIAAKFDRDVATPVWSANGDGLFFQYDDTGSTRLGFISLSGEVTKLADHVGGVTLGRPYSSGSFSVADNGTLAYTLSRPNFPADIAVLPTGSKKSDRITLLNEDLFGHKELAEIQEFRFESSVDRRKIQAWIVKPPGFDSSNRYPLILEIHGGPFANYGDRFSAEMQLYAAAGYVVLYVNPRGSTGYGQEFANLIHHAYPGKDYDDLMSAVDALIRRGFIDEKNLYVTGGSGGGVLTTWVVGKTGRFRAAVAAKPVVNWYSFTLTTDNYPFFSQYWFPGQPWEHVEHYLKRSPISLVGHVTTPTMLMTGEVDHRTPISQSEQFYQALKLRKIDTALVRVPGASHAIVKRPSRLMVKVAYILKWFEMHRRGK